MGTDLVDLEKKLWEAADELRANSKLKPAEFAVPVLGLIFLRYADARFMAAYERIEGTGGGRRTITPKSYKAEGITYVPEAARWDRLKALTEKDNLGQELDAAMEAIEAENADLRGVLPRTYTKVSNETLIGLIRLLNGLADIEGDAFGLIYEYFLGNFAMAEGSRGGEFFTPTSIVKLMVEIIEPTRGRMLDPACGSGGMFVQSARFVERHHKGAPGERISLYGQDRVDETVRLANMNLAIHGLEGNIRQGNTYYEDLHNSVGAFDYVLANPPFNVNKIDKTKLGDDRRFPFGLPKADNGNYLWIQAFYSALNETGRAGFVMANSASDARGSELEIRRQLIEAGVVDVIVSVSSNFFFTVTLPVTLWFLDKGKKGTARQGEVLFIDAREIFTQVTRAHRTWEPADIEFLANIVRLWRGREPEFDEGSRDRLRQAFPGGDYVDVPGLCGAATVEAIEGQSWSLSPGRYVAPRPHGEEDELKLLGPLAEEFEVLTARAADLESTVSRVLKELVR